MPEPNWAFARPGIAAKAKTINVMVKNFFIVSPFGLWNFVVLKLLKIGAALLLASCGHGWPISSGINPPLQTSRTLKPAGINCSFDCVSSVHVVHVLTDLVRCWVLKVSKLRAFPDLGLSLW